MESGGFRQCRKQDGLGFLGQHELFVFALWTDPRRATIVQPSMLKSFPLCPPFHSCLVLSHGILQVESGANSNKGFSSWRGKSFVGVRLPRMSSSEVTSTSTYPEAYTIRPRNSPANSPLQKFLYKRNETTLSRERISIPTAKAEVPLTWTGVAAEGRATRTRPPPSKSIGQYRMRSRSMIAERKRMPLVLRTGGGGRTW